jgi:hypothetical protein
MFRTENNIVRLYYFCYLKEFDILLRTCYSHEAGTQFEQRRWKIENVIAFLCKTAEHIFEDFC